MTTIAGINQNGGITQNSISAAPDFLPFSRASAQYGHHHSGRKNTESLPIKYSLHYEIRQSKIGALGCDVLRL